MDWPVSLGRHHAPSTGDRLADAVPHVDDYGDSARVANLLIWRLLQSRLEVKKASSRASAPWAASGGRAKARETGHRDRRTRVTDRRYVNTGGAIMHNQGRHARERTLQPLAHGASVVARVGSRPLAHEGPPPVVLAAGKSLQEAAHLSAATWTRRLFRRDRSPGLPPSINPNGSSSPRPLFACCHHVLIMVLRTVDESQDATVLCRPLPSFRAATWPPREMSGGSS